MPMSSMTAGADVVPTTSSRRPFGGCFFSSTSSVCAHRGHNTKSFLKHYSKDCTGWGKDIKVRVKGHSQWYCLLFLIAMVDGRFVVLYRNILVVGIEKND